jgi:hypothetical protein
MGAPAGGGCTPRDRTEPRLSKWSSSHTYS